MQLTGHEIKELLDLVNPDAEAAPEQLDESVTLVAREAFVSTDGEQMPAGIYAILADHSEEGLYGPLSGNNKRRQRINREIKEVSAYLVDEMKAQLSHFFGIQWQSPDTVPDVELGGEKLFWLAVKSIRDGVEREHTFLANYLNKPMLLDAAGEITEEAADWLLGNEDEIYVETIGWYDAKEHSDYNGWYESIVFNENYVLLGWAEYNAPPFFVSEPVKPKTITEDPAYKSLVERYSSNWTLAVLELFGMNPTWHHEQILESAQKIGSKTSVVAGGDEKAAADLADITSAAILLFMLFNPDSLTVVVSDVVSNPESAVWNALKANFDELCRRHPWIGGYFTISDDLLFERTHEHGWGCVNRTYSEGNEEVLAGYHSDHLFFVVDGAERVSGRAFCVITGSMTQEDNRILLTGNATSKSGYFYDTRHQIAKRKVDDKIGYTVINMTDGEL